MSPVTSATQPHWLGALSSRPFRLFWIGHVISVAGEQMMWVAQGWLIYELTGSKLLLGANAVAQALPATVLALVGGVVADKVDQRRLVIAVQVVHAVLVGILAVLSFARTVEVWHLLALSFSMAAFGAFSQPARHALFPHLVDRRALTSAVALNAMVHPGTRMLGPAVVGGLLAWVMNATSSAMVAAGAAFAVAALGFVVQAVSLWFVHLPPVHRAVHGSVARGVMEGLRYIWGHRVAGLLIGIAYFNMFFALSMSVLYPVFAKDILGVGPSGLGLLHSAQGVGNLLGAILGGSLGSAWRRNWMIVGGSVVLGAFLTVFALSTWYALSLVALGVSGVGASMYNVSVQASLQLLAPDALRGRVMGVWGMVHTSVRPMGEMQLAGLAALVSAPFALALGGVLVIAFAVLVVAPNRRLRDLGDPTPAA